MKYIGTILLLAAGSAAGMAQAECSDFVVRMHITEAEHFSSTGNRISEAGAILQQNLYNVDSGVRIDEFETVNLNFQSRNARAALAEAARAVFTPSQKGSIEDITRENVVTLGLNGCVNFDTKSADYKVTHLNFSEITEDGYSVPFMSAADDQSMWAPQNQEFLSNYFHKDVGAEDFRIAYLTSPEAKLMMMSDQFFCGSLGCSAVLLDAQDKVIWEGEMVEYGASIIVASNGNIINIYNARNELSQISMPD